MTTARLTANYTAQGHRVVLRLTAPPEDGGCLAIETVDIRDRWGTARAAAFVERADELLTSGALDMLTIDPDGAATLAEAFGV